MPLHEDAASSAASSPAVRATLAWSGFGTAEMLQRLGITSWSEAAGMAATVYTLFLIVDWLLKKARWWLYRRRVARLEAAHRGD